MPKKNHKSNASLGKTLQNKHAQRVQPRVVHIPVGDEVEVKTFKVHVSDEPRNQGPQLKSILEQNSLDEFMQYAEMSQKKFTSDKFEARQVVQEDTTIIRRGEQDSSAMINKFLTHENVNNPQYRPLKIPRRPRWKKSMTAQEIHQQESLAFLEWRRDLAAIEEGNIKLAITPFEKNIEVWRQLWRVIEKSDLLLQIVDARNPYFFYSEDLEQYISEQNAAAQQSDDSDEDEDDDSNEEDGEEQPAKSQKIEKEEAKGQTERSKKQFILCINKADYLTEELIKHWSEYFKEKGVQHIFISAKKEQEKLDNEEEESDEDSEGSDLAADSDDEEKEFEPLFGDLKREIDHDIEKKEEEAKLAGKQGKTGGDSEKDEAPESKKAELNTTRVFAREDLLEYLRGRAKDMGKDHTDRLHVGTVGYPNVGKSSLINVLCGRKRVGVAAMPGKTKHFQTLLLENTERDICLVDCPGLVFPSFANSKAEMYCCGVLPIQTITEYMSPCTLIAARISRRALQSYYKLALPAEGSKDYTARTVLSLVAMKKGWVTGSSNPDVAQAAKRLLADYTTGAVVFCHLRPDYSLDKHGAVAQCGFDDQLQLEAQADPEATAHEESESVNTAQVTASTAAGAGKAVAQSEAVTVAQPTNKSMPALLDHQEAAFEAQLDKDFFQASGKGKKAKLTKAEKRALKFMVRRDDDEGGAYIKDDASIDVHGAKAKIAKDQRKAAPKNFVETGGGAKFVGARGNHSNKLIE